MNFGRGLRACLLGHGLDRGVVFQDFAQLWPEKF